MSPSTSLSRAQIETLCVLHAVGPKGCVPTAVAERLGLSPGLSGAVASAVMSLEQEGLLSLDEGRAVLTTMGRARLAEVR